MLGQVTGLSSARFKTGRSKLITLHTGKPPRRSPLRTGSRFDFGDVNKVKEVLVAIGTAGTKTAADAATGDAADIDFSGSLKFGTGSKLSWSSDPLAAQSVLLGESSNGRNFVMGFNADDVEGLIRDGKLAPPNQVEFISQKIEGSLSVDAGWLHGGTAGTFQRSVMVADSGVTSTTAFSFGQEAGASLPTSLPGLSLDGTASMTGSGSVSVVRDASGAVTQISVMAAIEARGTLTAEFDAVLVGSESASYSAMRGTRTVTFDLTDPTVAAALGSQDPGAFSTALNLFVARPELGSAEVALTEVAGDSGSGDFLVASRSFVGESEDPVSIYRQLAGSSVMVRVR